MIERMILNMKKKFLLLGMITCMLGLSACGSADEVPEEPFMSEEDAILNAESIVEMLQDVVAQDAVESFSTQYETTYPAVVTGLNSWISAQEDMGDYVGIVGSEVNYDDDQVTVIVTVDGSVHDAEVEVIMDEMAYLSITTNVKFSLGELMKNAFLNTVLGMGTVFIVLILIAFIIYLFGFIPKIQESFAKKKKKEEAVAKEAIDNSVTQVAAKEEEVEASDDLELVAVIAAAVAASEGQASPDGFVVRSIRRRY